MPISLVIVLVGSTLPLLATLGVMCTSSQETEPPLSLTESGVEGQALVGPACPGPVRSDRPCSDRPLQTTLAVLDASEQLVARVDTDADGRFRISLPPGQYMLRPELAARFPFASPVDVVVAEGQYTYTEIHFDSGMR